MTTIDYLVLIFVMVAMLFIVGLFIYGVMICPF